MRVIIAGGRDFEDEALMIDAIIEYGKQYGGITEVVCGGAKGADAMGKRLAQKHKIPVKNFPALWLKYGKSAGPIRNKEMAEYAEGCLCLWDGKSRGTQHMINLAKQYNLKLKVVLYNQ